MLVTFEAGTSRRDVIVRNQLDNSRWLPDLSFVTVIIKQEVYSWLGHTQNNCCHELSGGDILYGVSKSVENKKHFKTAAAF